MHEQNEKFNTEIEIIKKRTDHGMWDLPRPGPRSSWAPEPQLLNLHVWSLYSTTREAAIVRGPCTAMKSGPHLPQLEEALTQKRRPNTAKNK